MKDVMKLLVGLFIILIFTAGLFSGDYYYVQFENNPKLQKGNKVSFKGFNIGEIKDLKLTDDNFILLKIEIKDKYKKKLVETGVFYAEDKKLKYIVLDNDGKKVKSGSYFIGFKNKYKYYIWKTKGWLKEGAKAIKNKLKEEKGNKI